MKKKLLATILKLAVSVSLLYFLFHSVDLGVFLSVVTNLDPLVFLFLALYFIGIQSISTFRWSIVLKKDVQLPYPRLFSIYLIGMFFNNFLPTIVGGDVVKGYYLYKKTRRVDITAASILMDRYSGFTALMAITIVALVPGYPFISGTGLPGFFVLLVGVYIAVSLFVWDERLHGWLVRVLTRIRLLRLNEIIENFYTALMSYKDHRAILLKIFLCSLVIQVGVIMGYVMLARGLGIDTGTGYFFLFVPLATAVSMIPVSLSGLGIREGAFVFLFTRVGATQEEALGLSLLWFFVVVFVSLIGGVEYIRIGGKKELVSGTEEESLS
jgi:uncharacterized protein (TIRG00374 family)